ncbi:malonyl-CoA decarboxylase domain-containing protein [Novosphingobium colocasiae]|uniref:Decarboxylase n=1 Tax=Novosphingobium colocasiae TaxID=1256513 RepID=A0A918P9W9_9SPHN|nr:malonyl-CoA decarboxylase family protein [Novosphingobium colocasiae]GGY91334.1 decarboxylase [Novosphingobium colocasiae]
MTAARTSLPAEAAAPSRKGGAFDRIFGAGLGKLLRGFGVSTKRDQHAGLFDLADALLSPRGRASGPALASAFFTLYEQSPMDARQAFLAKVHDLHPADAQAIAAAIARWQRDGDEEAARALNAATESPSRRLIRLLNLAPQGTQRLIGMREDLLAAPDRSPGLKAFDRELESAFANWFNAGFLELRRIGWDTSARLLERIIAYEAVHEIKGWDDLRRRLEPVDRRCYGFFHPQMQDDPLIFVEVALTDHLPGAIHDVIAAEREPIDPRQASHAIFYSISNCQVGLKGIPFGNYLIKRVVGLLSDELPQLKTFATLSPVPGFAKWLAKDRPGAAVPDGDELRSIAARYLVEAKGAGNQPVDPVARFHLGNGARLEAVHAGADLSANGRKQAHGVMVNYLYDLDDIEANYFALTETGTVATSKAVRALLEETQDAKPAKGKRKGDEPKTAEVA